MNAGREPEPSADGSTTVGPHAFDGLFCFVAVLGVRCSSTGVRIDLHRPVSASDNCELDTVVERVDRYRGCGLCGPYFGPTVFVHRPGHVHDDDFEQALAGAGFGSLC